MLKILPPRLKGAAGPNPDPRGDDEETDARLMPIPALPEVKSLRPFSVFNRHLASKYRDPLHLLLEYIAKVSVVTQVLCTFVLI
jgi:hypothetical protein